MTREEMENELEKLCDAAMYAQRQITDSLEDGVYYPIPNLEAKKAEIVRRAFSDESFTERVKDICKNEIVA